jgi:hypothetical protein
MKTKRKFIIIVKVDSINFVKYRCNDLNNFFNVFIKNKYPQSRYANIFSNVGANKNQLVKTWGRNKGLQDSY